MANVNKIVPIKIPDEYLRTLNINGMEGRMLHIPAKNKNSTKKWLIVYGHHSSLERMYSLAQFISKYGEVYVPDLPGFGGMDSFYKIKKEPTIDNLADYIRGFTKLHFKTDHFSVVSMSFGFLIITRMLQKSPALSKRIDKNISFVGFGRRSDFMFQGFKMKLGVLLSKLFSTKLGSGFMRFTVMSPPVVWVILKIVFGRKKKFSHVKPEEADDTIKMEIALWGDNNKRTHFFTMAEMLTANLPSSGKKIPMSLHNIKAKEDQWFDTDKVHDTLEELYEKVDTVTADMESHGASVVATVEEVDRMVPEATKKYAKR